MKKGFLLLKGSYSQKQFDTLSKIWDNLQKGKAEPEDTLPAIQLNENASVAIVQFEKDGSITVISLGSNGAVNIDSTKRVTR